MNEFEYDLFVADQRTLTLIYVEGMLRRFAEWAGVERENVPFNTFAYDYQLEETENYREAE